LSNRLAFLKLQKSLAIRATWVPGDVDFGEVPLFPETNETPDGFEDICFYEYQQWFSWMSDSMLTKAFEIYNKQYGLGLVPFKHINRVVSYIFSLYIQLIGEMNKKNVLFSATHGFSKRYQTSTESAAYSTMSKFESDSDKALDQTKQRIVYRLYANKYSYMMQYLREVQKLLTSFESASRFVLEITYGTNTSISKGVPMKYIRIVSSTTATIGRHPSNHLCVQCSNENGLGGISRIQFAAIVFGQQLIITDISKLTGLKYQGKVKYMLYFYLDKEYQFTANELVIKIKASKVPVEMTG